MRIMRSALLEVLRQDYIRTAWSKGLPERAIVLRHALKNALIPVVSLIGLQMPLYIGGSVIIEAIFRLPGVGLFFFEALTRLDYPVVQSVNLIVAAMVVGLNLAHRPLVRVPRSADPLPVSADGRPPPPRVPIAVDIGGAADAAVVRGGLGPDGAAQAAGHRRRRASCWSCCSLAVFADVLTPYGFAETNLRERFVPDERRPLARAPTRSAGTWRRASPWRRVSLYVGFGAVALASLIATLLGIFSAYWGGRVDLLAPARRRRLDGVPAASDPHVHHVAAGPERAEHHARARYRRRESATRASCAASRCRSARIRTSRARGRWARATPA